MANYTLVCSTSVVSLNPEWDIKFDDKKIETDHRTRSGAGYRYKWGSYKRVTFGAEFVSSSDMCTINSWWGANQPVVLWNTTSAVVISGYLVNASAPIDSYIQPYTDSFKGVIELESF